MQLRQKFQNIYRSILPYRT